MLQFQEVLSRYKIEFWCELIIAIPVWEIRQGSAIIYKFSMVAEFGNVLRDLKASRATSLFRIFRWYSIFIVALYSVCFV